MEKYFDYAATAPVDKKLLEIYNEISQKYYKNSQNDYKSEKMVEKSKNKILELLSLNDTYEVIYTSGGTEANNLGIIGAFKNAQEPLHFITSSIEHSSILESFQELERNGHNVDYIDPDINGVISIDKILNKITPKTKMIAIMAVNNELGNKVCDLHVLKEKTKEIKENILIFSDLVQAIGKFDISFSDLDMFSISGHKIYTPKGIGVLVKKKKIKLSPLLFGGAGNIRPGTQCIGLEVAFVNGLKKALINQNERIAHVEKMKKLILDKYQNNPKVKINGFHETTVLSLTLNTICRGETMVEYLRSKDIYVSTKSACSQKANVHSHVLKGIGLDPKDIDRTIRISFSHLTTEEEVKSLIDEIDYILQNL